MINNLKNILKQYNFIEFALLFGSYSKNKESFLSDIDIGIYTKYDIDILTLGEITANLESNLNKKIDLVILNNLYKTAPKLAYNISIEHKIIFIKQKNNYIEFKINSLKYYTDIKYMYDIFDNSLKERLKNGTYGKIKAS